MLSFQHLSLKHSHVRTDRHHQNKQQTGWSHRDKERAGRSIRAVERSPGRISTPFMVLWGAAEVTEPGQALSCGKDGCKLLEDDLGQFWGTWMVSV